MAQAYGSAVVLRFSVVLLACVLLLASSSARVLPKVKRDNSTCCGYKVINQGNALFRYESITEFDKMTTIDQVYKAGWTISNKWKVGGSNSASGRAQYSVADEKNVKIVNGLGLTLTIPGGQDPNATTFSAAEIIFPDVGLGGIWEIEAKVTKVPGSVFGFFTYHGDPYSNRQPWKDAQAYEMLSSTIMEGNAYNKPGMQTTNFEPTTGATSGTITPFPSDPTTGFHRYSIAWFPTLSNCPAMVNAGRMTEYRYDGALLKGPTKYASIHPSELILNLWTTGSVFYSQGPPLQDATVTIKSLRVYYDKPKAIANNTCPTVGDFQCTADIACPVTM